MEWLKGEVRWFDKLRGEGIIRVEDGSKSTCVYVHYSAIDKEVGLVDGKLDKDFYWRLLFEGQDVYVKLVRDSHYTQIEELI